MHSILSCVASVLQTWTRASETVVRLRGAVARTPAFSAPALRCSQSALSVAYCAGVILIIHIVSVCGHLSPAACGEKR